MLNWEDYFDEKVEVKQNSKNNYDYLINDIVFGTADTDLVAKAKETDNLIKKTKIYNQILKMFENYIEKEYQLLKKENI